MGWKRALAWSLPAAAVAGGLAVGRRQRVLRTRRERVSRVLSGVSGEREPVETAAATASMPAPARRYLRRVLPETVRLPTTARIHQRGQFRLGGEEGGWKPYTAVHHVATEPPGFVWDASIRVAPLLPVRVVDAYVAGRGSLRANLLSVLPVATVEPGPAMNEAQLQRYLAETPWVPTGLLPRAGVEWEPIADDAARATLQDGQTTASLVFHFTADDRVERVVAERRFRQERGDYERWSGHFRAYERRGGVELPTRAHVEWNGPEGDLAYWRGRIGDVATEVLRGAP